MALEDPRDKSTRGQRTSEGRTGPAGRGGSDKGGSVVSDGGISITRLKKGVAVPGAYPRGPIQIDSVPNGPTLAEDSPANKALDAMSYNDAFNAIKTHQQAVQDYKNRSIFGQLADFALGPIYNERVPDFNNPHSWSGGTWHSSTNVPGVLGMLGGAAAGIPFGGLAGSTIGDLTGIPEVWHGGSGPNSWGPASSGGLGLGGQPGASPTSHDGKTGINSGLLGLGVTSPTPAQSQLNQSNVPQQAQQQNGLNFGNIPSQYQPIGGPSPYGVNFPSWNYQYR